jgi:DNA polymerase III delta prime subunit
MIQHTILNEKYRANKLEDFICSDEIREKLEQYIIGQDIPHLLFAGKAGIGKTTLAKLLVNNIECDFLYINATDERSMDVMRDKVKDFASAASFKPLKVIILDEATHLLQASQVILLNMMETYSLKTRFILTGNYIERLIEPLRSRCTEFKLVPPSKSRIAEHLCNILESEDVKYNLEDLALIINQSYPDIRRITNTCQKYITGNELKVSKSITSSLNFMEKILKELKNPNSNSFLTIRQTIVNSNSSQYDEVYKYLFDNVSSYALNKEGEVIVILNEYLYQSSFVLDKEINILAAISKVLEILNKKQILKG